MKYIINAFLRCPHCGKKTISIWEKMFLNPRYNYKCKECGKYINIPYYTIIIFGIISLVIIYLVLVLLKKEWDFLILILIPLVIIYKLIVLFYVPIIKK